MMTVVPLISRNSRCTASSVVAVQHRHTVDQLDALVFLGLVGDHDDPGRAFGRIDCAICTTEWPSARSPTCCPPVIATASLYRIL
jgi:hypothetical protein